MIWSFLLLFSSAWGWEEHRSFAPWILKELQQNNPYLEWVEKHKPTFSDNQGMDYYHWAKELGLQTSFPGSNPYSLYSATSVEEMLVQSMDEPDYGMDQNLPDEFDPKNERVLMGGKTGLTSQGFRHMYFAGWNWKDPITTFQLPLEAFGQAPIRFQKMALAAKKEIRAGHYYWGFRLLGWALHYIQDLTQPFHTLPIPNLKMVPWQAVWHNGKFDWNHLVLEATRTIGNYHTIYEKWVLRELKNKDLSRFDGCLSQTAFIPSVDSLADFTNSTIYQTRKDVAPLGNAVVGFFGAQLKEPSYDLFKNKGTVDLDALTFNPQKAAYLEKIEAATCDKLKNTLSATMGLIVWAIQE